MDRIDEHSAIYRALMARDRFLATAAALVHVDTGVLAAGPAERLTGPAATSYCFPVEHGAHALHRSPRRDRDLAVGRPTRPGLATSR